jgi:hypothetical protein
MPSPYGLFSVPPSFCQSSGPHRRACQELPQRPSIHDPDPADLLVIAAPRVERSGKRIVGWNDASVEAIPEAAYQQAVQRLRAYLREHPSPK